MANRQLTESELVIANEMLDEVRARIGEVAGGDTEFAWALRRKIYKELTYDERGKPMSRRILKAKKFGEQSGSCAQCEKPLPEKGAILDRLKAMDGYTSENVELVCPACDRRRQEARRYT